MRIKGFVIAILLAAVAAGPSIAEEVIYFTNGTVMPIRSHEVEGELIKVDLGDNGYMAFPKSVVEKIEEAPDVVLMPSTGTNKMFAGDPSTRVYGAAPRQASTTWALPMQTDEPNPERVRAVGGVVTRAPRADDPHPAVRELRVYDQPTAYEGRKGQQIPGMRQKVSATNPKAKKTLARLQAKD